MHVSATASHLGSLVLIALVRKNWRTLSGTAVCLWTGGVIFSVAGKKLFDRLNIASLRCDQQVLLSIQFKLLGDGSESHFDCFGTNLLFIFRKAVVLHIASEGSQKIGFFAIVYS